MSVRVKSCNGVTVISKVSNQRWKCIKFNPLFFAGHNWVFWFFSYWDSNASSSIISFSPAIIDYSGLSPIEIQMHQVDLLFLAGHDWLFCFFLLLTFKVCLCIYCYVFVSVMYLFVCMAVCHWVKIGCKTFGKAQITASASFSVELKSILGRFLCQRRQTAKGGCWFGEAAIDIKTFILQHRGSSAEIRNCRSNGKTCYDMNFALLDIKRR